MEYRGYKFLRQLVAEIPWGQNILIFSKIKDVKAREYYIKATIKMAWSRKVLLNQIKSETYERHFLNSKQHNFKTVLPIHLAEQADESMKSIYNLDFLGITEPVLERELEQMLIRRIKEFVLELGYGFSFIGSQYKLDLNDNEYFIDLLFYNRLLKSLVAIELKTGKFKLEYASKMDFYLSLIDEQVRLEGENSSIGIILCADKDNIEVEYALKNTKNAVDVAEYQLIKKLPKKLKDKLPDPAELKAQIKKEINHLDICKIIRF